MRISIFHSEDDLTLHIHITVKDNNISIEKLESDILDYLKYDFCKNSNLDINNIKLLIISNINRRSEISVNNERTERIH